MPAPRRGRAARQVQSPTMAHGRTLRLTAGLPEIRLAAGDTVVREGEAGDGCGSSVSGAAAGRKAGVADQHDQPARRSRSARSRCCWTRPTAPRSWRASRARCATRADGRALLLERPGHHPLRRGRPGRAAGLRHHLPGRPEAPVRRCAGPGDGLGGAAAAGAAARACAGAARFGARPEPRVLKLGLPRPAAQNDRCAPARRVRRRSASASSPIIERHEAVPASRSISMWAGHRPDLAAGVEDPGAADAVGPGAGRLERRLVHMAGQHEVGPVLVDPAATSASP